MPTRRYDDAIMSIRNQWKRGLTLKAVAAEYGVDPGDLDRVFRRKYGVTAFAYVRSRREAYLLDRLADTEVYGYEIGSELGFFDDWSFYRWVKRGFGISFTRLRSKVVKGKGDAIRRAQELRRKRTLPRTRR